MPSLPQSKKAIFRTLENTTQKFSKYSGKALPFPVQAFPEPIQKIIRTVSEITEGEESHLGTAMLAAIAATSGNTHNIRIPKVYKPIPPIFFAAIVEGQGRGKSAALDFVMAPIFRIEDEYRKEQESELARWTEQTSGMKDDEKPPRPVGRRLIINNITPEKIYRVHQVNPKSLLYFKDELSGWIDTLNQYRKGDDEQFWMQLYNGSTAIIDRVNAEDPLYLMNPFVGVLGGMTPNSLIKFAKNGMEENGFMFRIAFSYPEKKMLREDLSEEDDTEIPYEVIRYWSEVVNRVNNLTYDPDGVTTLDIPKHLRKRYWEWQNHNNHQINTADTDVEEGIHARIRGIFARTALILELMRWGCNQSAKVEISEQSLEGAILLTEYYRSCSIKALLKMTNAQIAMLDASNSDRKFFQIDWKKVFGEDAVLHASEIKRRVREIYPEIKDRTIRQRQKEDLQSASSYGMYKRPDNTVSSNKKEEGE